MEPTASTSMLTEESTKEDIAMMKDTPTVHSSGLMENDLWVNGKQEEDSEKELSTQRMVLLNKNGKKAHL